VHQAALRQNIRSLQNKRQKGNNKSKPRGPARQAAQVNSAYSNVNKSVRKKLETHTMSGKHKNVHTDFHCDQWCAQNPGKTKRDCLDQLPACGNCGKRGISRKTVESPKVTPKLDHPIPETRKHFERSS
jgi:hypothetical protein